MRVLALDSTTGAGSVALLAADDDGRVDRTLRVIDQRVGDASRPHAERLPAELTALVEANGLSLADVDLFAVASGPGSFTGLRIGIATMQGLALVRGRPLIGVTALDALGEAGAAHAPPGATIAVWMDAHRREVFTALYTLERAAGAVRAVEREGARVDDPAATLTRWRARRAAPSAFVGGGASLYAATIREHFPAAAIVATPPLASYVGRLGAMRAAGGASTHPAALQPVYVRRPDAELARQRDQACRE